MIHFVCPSCDRALKVNNNLAGKKGKCPSCGVAVRVPRVQELVASATCLEISEPAVPPPTETASPSPSEPAPAGSTMSSLSSWISQTSQMLPSADSLGANLGHYMDSIGPSLEPYMPALRQFACQQVVRMGSDFVRNQECMSAVLGTAYTVILPAPVRLVLPQSAFIQFGLGQIDRIFGPDETSNR